MSPLTRRGFLGALAAVPVMGRFVPYYDKTNADITFGFLEAPRGARTVPIVFGEVPREWLTLPYYRALDRDFWSLQHGTLKYITSYDQDPELKTSEVTPRRS